MDELLKKLDEEDIDYKVEDGEVVIDDITVYKGVTNYHISSFIEGEEETSSVDEAVRIVNSWI